MKTRATKGAGTRPGSELKGVVKRTAGRLTNDPRLEREGHKEMYGQEAEKPRTRRRSRGNPDPHRRG